MESKKIMSFCIFHIIPNIGMGGAQTMMLELYHAFDRYYPQYKQRVFYQNNLSYNDALVSSYNVPCSMADSSKIIKKLNNNKNTVVIYHKLASSNYKILEQIKSKTKSKIIVINHTLYQSSSWKHFKQFDIMIAVSDHMNNKIDKWYPKINHDFIHNGVDGSRYEKIKASGVSGQDVFLTGRINRICGWKYSDKWIKWCSSVKLPKRMIHEYMGAGIGSKGRAGRNRPKTHKGRNEVNMLGGIDNFATKVSIIKNWDVFLYEVNRNEGVSMAILEAMACGIPIICSNHYGNKEIIVDGVNGYVFSDKDHAQKILINLINNPKELKELKKTTKQYFDDNLDAKHTVNKYMDVIYKITGEDKDVKKKFKERIIEASKTKPVVNDKFTIMTSGYNKSKYLNEWADSIIKQKYRPMEVIFANDKSGDDTLVAIKGIEEKFKANDIEFKLVDNKKQLYCGGSYHNLTNYISGFYVGVLDADDMLAVGAVEYVVKLYKDNPDIYWVYTQFLWCDEQMTRGRKGLNSAPPKGQSLLDLGDKGIHGIGSGFRTFSGKIDRPDKLFGRHLTCAVDKNMGYRLEEFGPGLYTERKCYIHRGHPVGSIDSVSSTKNAMRMWKQVIKEAHSRRKKYNKKARPIRVVNGS
jgi:glycosyltransferase involved in cell wall biosynthesis